MHLSSLYIIASLLIFSSTTYATTIGRVVKVKGKTSILIPGQHEAFEIKLGQKIVEDSSILTQNKSIVIIIFNDKTKMVIGPKSKIIVKKFTKKSQGVISLLKGKLRADIQKNKKGGLKFFVKSRTASLGVRGTSFQTTFNPESNLTSLLTFTGEVAMVNTKKPKKNKAGQRTKQETTVEALTKALSSKKAVSVKAGTYSGVSDNLKKATAPVKISPNQFARIKLNKSFGIDQKKIKQEDIIKEIKAIVKIFSKDKTTQESENLHINPKTGEYHPRSGGLVDSETGIYIPPTADAVYDKKSKVFKATRSLGSINTKGDYIAPKGIILTNKGFIVKDQNTTKQAKLNLKKLNHRIKGQIKKPKKVKYSLDDLNDDNVYDRYFED